MEISFSLLARRAFVQGSRESSLSSVSAGAVCGDTGQVSLEGRSLFLADEEVRFRESGLEVGERGFGEAIWDDAGAGASDSESIGTSEGGKSWKANKEMKGSMKKSKCCKKPCVCKGDCVKIKDLIGFTLYANMLPKKRKDGVVGEIVGYRRKGRDYWY